MSFSVRFRQPFGAVASTSCQLGLASSVEQPEPVPPQTDSVQARRPERRCVSFVPPTAVTYCVSVGYSAP